MKNIKQAENIRSSKRAKEKAHQEERVHALKEKAISTKDKILAGNLKLIIQAYCNVFYRYTVTP